MKYIIMFKGGVETLEYFSMEMARTFEENGFKIYWFDLIFEQESAKKLKSFIEQNAIKDGKAFNICAFTFNFAGIAGEEGLFDDTNFWNEMDIFVYNMVVDHPFYYHKYAKYIPKKYKQISIDRNHEIYLRRFFPHINSFFMPLGGTGLYERKTVGIEKQMLSYNERPIDIIFTGNYTRPETFDKFLVGIDKDYREFYYSLVDEVYNNPDTLIEDLLERRLKQEIDEPISDIQLRECMPNLAFVDLSVRFYYRADVIRTLVDSGRKVYIVGAGWDKLECKHPENIIMYGSGYSQDCLDKIAQSKLSVNVMPWFKDGAHDRIFNSMLNGAVSVSDDSTYLRQVFNDREDICFYSLKNVNEVVDIVQELLDNPSLMKDIASVAYDKCIKMHTWKQRTLTIIDVMAKDMIYNT